MPHPRVLLGRAILLLSAGCTPANREAVACPAGRLDVLVFNIEYGGDLVDFAGVVAAIRSSGARIVAIEEAYGHTDRLAAALGWTHFDRRTQVLSRDPLVAVRGASGTALSFVEVTAGCVVAVGNVHLPSDPVVDTLVLQGKTAEAIAIERQVRLPPLEPVLKDLGALAAQGIPVFLVGDFNAGSHLDGPLQWPTSRAADSAGFTDSYRATHPDPAAHPGFTWWAARPQVAGWNPSPADPQQRIDYLYSAGPAKATTSRIIGERGGRDVDIGVDPWVSDHRALVSSFEVLPAPVPAFVGVTHQRAVAGDSITVEFSTRGAGVSVVLFDAGGPTVGSGRARRTVAPSRGIATVRLGSTGLLPGAYEVVLVTKDGTAEAQSTLWLTARAGKPAVATGRTAYRPGEAIEVRWSDSPGNRWDWVGVYPMTAKPDSSNPVVWRHTGAAVGGTTQLGGAAEGSEWPVPPGRYRLILGLDDSYTVLAETAFDIGER